MKKTAIPNKAQGKDDLLREYRLDYSKAKPNRFAAEMPAETIAVVLEMTWRRSSSRRRR